MSFQAGLSGEEHITWAGLFGDIDAPLPRRLLVALLYGLVIAVPVAGVGVMLVGIPGLLLMSFGEWIVGDPGVNEVREDAWGIAFIVSVHAPAVGLPTAGLAAACLPPRGRKLVRRATHIMVYLATLFAWLTVVALFSYRAALRIGSEGTVEAFLGLAGDAFTFAGLVFLTVIVLGIVLLFQKRHPWLGTVAIVSVIFPPVFVVLGLSGWWVRRRASELRHEAETEPHHQRGRRLGDRVRKRQGMT